MQRNEHGAATGRPAALAALLVCGLLTGGCSTATTPTSGSPALHAMRADRLSEVMKSFDASVRGGVAIDVDSYARSEGIFPDVAEAAEALVKSAEDLSDHPPKELRAPDRERFQVMARSLASAAAELRDAAARDDGDSVESARTRLGTACRDCHEQYRPDSPGVPDAFRSSLHTIRPASPDDRNDAG